MEHNQEQDDSENPSERLNEYEEDLIPSRCSICYSEPPINAVKLECNHVFCYMCIKSTAETIGQCALCRSEIGLEFNFMNHRILGVARVPTSNDGYYWFYEGYKGWWLYDADTNRDLEDALQRGVRLIQRHIAGTLYTLDIENMVQQRSDGEGRSRKMCRNTLEIENILGMSGLKGEDFDDILETMKFAARNYEN